MRNIKELIQSDLQGGDYALNPEVFFVLASDGSGRLCDMEDFFYAISPIGTQMLQQALSQDCETAIDEIAQLYDVDKDTIRKDYTVLLQNLEKHGLITQSSAPRQPGTPENETLSIALLPLLQLIRRLPLRSRAWTLMTLSHLMLSLWGWNRTVSAWIQAHRVLDTRSEYGVESIRHAFRAVAARHLIGINCKERSLFCLVAMRHGRHSIINHRRHQSFPSG